MIIRQSAVDMTGSSTYREATITQERLQVWGGTLVTPAAEEAQLQMPADVITLSAEVQAKYQELKAASQEDTAGLSKADQVKVSILEMVIQIISGRKVKLKLPQLTTSGNQTGEPVLPTTNTGLRFINGWGMSWERETIYQEEATMNFQAQGQVTTQDGRTINFNLQLHLERSYWSRESIRVGIGQAIDPLVINFDAATAMTGSQRFSFDLNSDGVNEEMATLQRGSGFLALDLNGDNQINDGRELFGPQSGDGFTDLAVYDEDGNGWIDENDLIFNQLRIWTVDDSGQQQLFSLKEKNIGAIYLGQAATDFALKDGQNQEQARIKSSGVFLREDGTAGTIQDLDMIV